MEIMLKLDLCGALEVCKQLAGPKTKASRCETRKTIWKISFYFKLIIFFSFYIEMSGLD